MIAISEKMVGYLIRPVKVLWVTFKLRDIPLSRSEWQRNFILWCMKEKVCCQGANLLFHINALRNAF